MSSGGGGYAEQYTTAKEMGQAQAALQPNYPMQNMQNVNAVQAKTGLIESAVKDVSSIRARLAEMTEMLNLVAERVLGPMPENNSAGSQRAYPPGQGGQLHQELMQVHIQLTALTITIERLHEL